MPVEGPEIGWDASPAVQAYELLRQQSTPVLFLGPLLRPLPQSGLRRSVRRAAPHFCNAMWSVITPSLKSMAAHHVGADSVTQPMCIYGADLYPH